MTEYTGLIAFDVPGTPVAQGSKKAFVVGHGPKAHAVVVDANKTPLDRYRSDIRAEAEKAMGDKSIVRTAAWVTVFFTFARPAGHFKRKGGLTVAAPAYPRKPDVDKAVRAVLDALTDVVLLDDSQVIDLRVVKAFDDDHDGVTYTSIAVTW